MPRVAVILVNYRAADTTLACLDSLAHLRYPAHKLTIYVVDNGGHDWHCLSRLTHAGPFQVVPVYEPVNNGFSAGNNAAIKKALPQSDAIWLLNNDALVQPDTLEALVNRYKQSDRPVLVGGVLHHPDGQFQQVATQINLWTGSSKGYTLREATRRPNLDSLSGACMLIPKVVFQTIGLLPEKHFLYFEDVAFCLAARQAGFACVLATDAYIIHAMGQTTNAMPQQRSYYYHRNRWQVCWQYAHGLQRLSLVSYGVVRLFRSMVKAMMRSSYVSQHRVFMLALGDALKGVSGPCPHQALT